MNGQVAIVTGAGADIGKAISEVLAGAGAAVVVSDLNATKAETVAEGIRKAGGQAARPSDIRFVALFLARVGLDQRAVCRPLPGGEPPQARSTLA